VIRRTTKICLEVVAGVVGGFALVLAVAAWRLGEGPVSLSFLTPSIERSLSRTDGSFLVDVDETVLVWAGWERALEIRAVGVRALVGDRLLAEVPEMSMSFNLVALVTGRIQPRWVEAIGPQLTAVREADGTVDFGLGGGSVGGEVADPEVLMEEWLRGGPGGDDPLASLQRVSVADADLIVDDRLLDRTWIATNLSFQIGRQDGRIAGWLEAALEVGADPIDSSVTFYYAAESRMIEAALEAAVPAPAALAPLLPGLPVLAGIDVPVQLRLTTLLSAQGVLEEAQLAAEFSAGAIDLASVGGPTDLSVGSGRIRLDLPAPVPVVELADIASLDWIIDGSVSARLPSGDDGPLDLTATLRDGGAAGPADLVMSISELRPTAFMTANPWVRNLLPAGQTIPQMTLPISVEAALTLGDHWRPTAVQFTLDAGPGTFRMPGLYEDPVPLGAMSVAGRYDLLDGAGEVTALRASIGGGSLSATGAVERPGPAGKRRLTVSAELAKFPVSALETYWPAPASQNARRWVVENIVGGEVTSGTVSIVGAIGANDFDLQVLDGRLTLSGATVHYARPLRPVADAAAVVEFDRDSFHFDFKGGAIDGVRIRSGTLHITDILIEEEQADIDLVAAGPIRDIMAVLNHPKLGYADRFGIVPAEAGGNAVADLRFDFPLIDALTFEDIAIGVEAKLAGVDLPRMVGDQPIRKGDLALTLDNRGMRLRGSAEIGAAPVTLDLLENFDGPRKDAPYASLYKVQGTIDAGDVRHYGFDPREWVQGPLGVDLVYRVVSPRDATIDLSLDLAAATIQAPLGLWDKAAGVGGHVGLTLDFPSQKLVAIPRLDLVSEGVSAKLALGFTPGGDLSDVQIGRMAVGRTDLRDSAVRFLDGHVDVTLAGPSLDLSTVLADGEPEEPSRGLLAETELEPGLPWTLAVQANLDRLFLAPDRAPLEAVELDVGHDRRQWRYITLTARTGGGKKVRLEQDLDAYANGRKPYLVRFAAEDFGALLRSADATDSIRDGIAVLEAHYEGEGGRRQLVGRFEVKDYGVRDAPFIAHLLNVASLTGIVGFLSRDEGLRLDGFETNFIFHDKRITLTNGRAWNTGIGLTAEGVLNLGNDKLDINGTIAPLYGVSQAIEWVPLLRDVLNPNREGVFAARFGLSGDLADPGVSVNPLSIVTPGFLRGFFDIFQSSDDSSTVAQPAQQPDDR